MTEARLNTLEARGLGKIFPRAGGELRVLADCDLSLAKGESVAVIGPSGAGKSTLLNLLSGLDSKDAGEIHFQGASLDELGPDGWNRWRRDRVGFVFQFHFLLPDFTALENVMIPARLQGAPEPADHERARSLLERMGLGDRLDHLPGELSGGEQQRVAVARAFMNRPALVLADEPFGNLDVAKGRELADLLFGLCAELGSSLVVVTHDLALAARADRVLELRDGRLGPASPDAAGPS
jgi:predicted ABC-type transport system involved in lysophospholipase L1 biosynthesis ATPase subunit